MSTTTGYRTRSYTAADQGAVLSLINADRLVGQPLATANMLVEALAGSSPIDSSWWAELATVCTDVLVGPDGVVRGVVSYAARPRDGAGVILWLHGGEQPDTVRTLVEHALAELAACSTVEAFSFATSLGLGLEALPVRHRPVTERALRDAGFVGEDLWRYMHRYLPAEALPQARTVHSSVPEPDARQLTVYENDAVVSEATIGLPTAGVGVLWWLSVAPAGRGQGLGRALLGSALDTLSSLGAHEVILFVDDDDPDPDSDRNRTAANRLYDSAGFTEIDRLCSYQLHR